MISLFVGELEVSEPDEGLHALGSAVRQTVTLLLRDSRRLHVGHAWLEALGSHPDLIGRLLLLVEHILHGFLAVHRCLWAQLGILNLRIVLHAQQITDVIRHCCCSLKHSLCN